MSRHRKGDGEPLAGRAWGLAVELGLGEVFGLPEFKIYL